MLFAHFGLAGEDPREDADWLFATVRRALEEPSVDLCVPVDARNISALCLPNNPQLSTQPSGVTWTVPNGGVQGLAGDLAEFQRLLDGFGEIDVPQWLYLCGTRWSAASALATLLADVGVEVRNPGEKGAIMAEVHRPGGTVISALLGAPIPPKDTDRQTLTAQIVATHSNTDHTVLRAGRLRRLLLSVFEHSDDESAWSELLTALLERRGPLLVLAKPDGSVAPWSWPGVPSAIPVFMDRLSIQQTIRDLDMEAGTYAIASLTMPKLSAWMLEADLEFVLNVFDDDGNPHYIRPGVGAIRALADGRVPTKDERAN